MEVLLYAPEQFENLCVLARTLEVFGFPRCYVFDPHRIVRDRYGRSYTQKLRTVSAGAFFKVDWLRVSGDPLEFLRAYQGRRVASVPRSDARSLHQFGFHRSDLLIIGAEARGLDASVLGACDERVTIPQSGVTESLNVAVAASILLAEFKRQEALRLIGD